MAMERSYIMVKPDGVQRGLVGEIIARFERKGYKYVQLSERVGRWMNACLPACMHACASLPPHPHTHIRLFFFLIHLHTNLQQTG